MPFAGVPEIVRRRALACGGDAWLAALPALVESLEKEWSIAVGRVFETGTEAYVAEARSLTDGSESVLKLMVDHGNARNEITALRLACGSGCAALLRSDLERAAVLLE